MSDAPYDEAGTGAPLYARGAPAGEHRYVTEEVEVDSTSVRARRREPPGGGTRWQIPSASLNPTPASGTLVAIDGPSGDMSWAVRRRRYQNDESPSREERIDWGSAPARGRKRAQRA